MAPPPVLGPSPVTLLPPGAPPTTEPMQTAVERLPQQRPGVRTCAGAAGMPAPVVRLPKMTNLYVGNIARGVSDDFMRQLLETCGPVKEWKRLEDPETKQLKTFGFCIYEEAEHVKRALALLNDTSVAGQVLPHPLPLSGPAAAACLDASSREL